MNQRSSNNSIKEIIYNGTLFQKAYLICFKLTSPVGSGTTCKEQTTEIARDTTSRTDSGVQNRQLSTELSVVSHEYMILVATKCQSLINCSHAWFNTTLTNRQCGGSSN